MRKRGIAGNVACAAMAGSLLLKKGGE